MRICKRKVGILGIYDSDIKTQIQNIINYDL